MLSLARRSSGRTQAGSKRGARDADLPVAPAEPSRADLPAIDHPDFAAAAVRCSLEQSDWLEALGQIGMGVVQGGRGDAIVSSVLRAIVRAIDDRGRAAMATMRVAPLDREFLSAAHAGDRLRDARDWAAAAEAYVRALNMYPRHPGYWIQLGHVRKEQGRLHAAEIAYRAGRALHAPVEDYGPHLDFVSERLGYRGKTAPLDKAGGAAGMAAAVTSEDAEQLGKILWGRVPDDVALCDLMRAESIRSALLVAIQHREFVLNNRRLLDLIALRWGR